MRTTRVTGQGDIYSRVVIPIQCGTKRTLYLVAGIYWREAMGVAHSAPIQMASQFRSIHRNEALQEQLLHYPGESQQPTLREENP